MNNLIKELEKIKNQKLNALQKTSILNNIAKKYNMFNSDVYDLFYKEDSK